MGVCTFIFSFLAAAALLAGGVLSWIAIDHEGAYPAANLSEGARMAFRYEAAGVCFIGFMALIQAFFHSRLPGITAMFTYAIVGLGFYSLIINTSYNGTASTHAAYSYRSTTGRFNAVFINELRLYYQSHKDDAVAADQPTYYEKLYLGSGILSYFGFLLSMMAQGGKGFAGNSTCMKITKVIFILLLTAVAIVGIFLVSASNTTNFPGAGAVGDLIALYASNVLVVSAATYIWMVAFNALLSGNQQLAGSTGVIFGVYSFYFLMKLLAVNDTLANSALVTTKDRDQTRTGYIFAWFTAIVAFISNITVYAHYMGDTTSG